jgi:hypothetical protein
MTADVATGSFGPYSFRLSPGEAEAAAARLGLRRALNGGLLASHVAPLTAFALIMAFASVLVLTGLMSRRAGEVTILLAAAAFMIQRLTTHWRIRRARSDGQATIARLQSAGALKATFDYETLSLDVDGHTLCVRYAECEDTENVGGLIYVWLRDGGPIVVPTRALGDADEAAQLVSRLSSHIGRARVGLEA